MSELGEKTKTPARALRLIHAEDLLQWFSPGEKTKTPARALRLIAPRARFAPRPIRRENKNARKGIATFFFRGHSTPRRFARENKNARKGIATRPPQWVPSMQSIQERKQKRPQGHCRQRPMTVDGKRCWQEAVGRRQVAVGGHRSAVVQQKRPQGLATSTIMQRGTVIC